MKIKVSEAKGNALNWLVAVCEEKRPSLFIFQQTGKLAREHHYSTDWSQGGPIIEREISKLFKNMCGTYTAQIRHEENHSEVLRKILVGYTNCAGPTPLIAAMRCYVASKLGEEVEIPDELVKG